MKKIIMTFLLAICLAIILPGYSVQARYGLGEIEAFENITGENKYIGANYRENYHLDIEEIGLIDPALGGLMNGIANILFGIIHFLAYVVVCVFYWSMTFDLGEILSVAMNEIQQSLHDIIFEPLFTLAFCGVAYVLIKKIVRRDMMGTVSEFAKVILIIIMSIMVVGYSDKALSIVTTFTKGISMEALTGINSANNTNEYIKNYSAEAAATLWKGMVHDPWVMLEFSGETVSSETVDKFLSIPPFAKKARADLIKNYPNTEEIFAAERAISRPPFLIVYLFVFGIKAVIYLAVAGMQLVFQVLACFYLVLAPVILLLAMLPGYELNIISIWLRKILETQLSILILTFFIGLLLKFDNLLYTNFSGDWGWLGVMFFQAMLSVGLFVGRHKILNMFTNIQKGIVSPGFSISRFKQSGSMTYEKAEVAGKKVGKSARKGARNGARKIKSGIDWGKDYIRDRFSGDKERPVLATEPEIDKSNIIQFEEGKNTINLKRTSLRSSNRFDSLKQQYARNGNWGNEERRFIPQKGAKLDATKKSNFDALRKTNLDTSRLKQVDIENTSNPQNKNSGTQQKIENTSTVQIQNSQKPNLATRNLQKTKTENQDKDVDVKVSENTLQNRPNLGQRTERVEKVPKSEKTIINSESTRPIEVKTYRLHKEVKIDSMSSSDKFEKKAVKEVKNKLPNLNSSKVDNKGAKQKNITAPQMSQRKVANRRV